MTYDIKPLSGLTLGSQATSVSDVVYAHLKEAILSGALEPGTPLLEVHLAAALGVSRTPVRQAVERLGLETLVRRLPNGRRVVARPTYKEIDDIYEVRISLESLAASLVARNSSDLEIALIARACDGMRASVEAASTQDLAELNAQFHSLIAQFSHNAYLDSFIAVLRNATVRNTESGLSVPGRAMEVYHQHVAVLEAIRSRDSDASAKAMAHHLTETRAFRLTQKVSAPSP